MSNYKSIQEYLQEGTRIRTLETSLDPCKDQHIWDEVSRNKSFVEWHLDKITEIDKCRKCKEVKEKMYYKKWGGWGL